MMMNDLISIIVPVYNSGQYLKDCVSSILLQDYENIEVLLIDDGSKDAYTIDLCDELARENEKVEVYHKPNGGSASARNYGIERAKGNYIGFIDSDDQIEPDMFSTLYHDLKTSEVRVALGGIGTEENGKLIDKVAPVASGVYNQKELLHYFMLGSFHSSCTNLYDRSLFSDVLFPENEVNEDYMLNYWIFKKIDKVSINERTLYHYIRREGSNTSSPASLKFLDWIKHTKLVLSEMGQIAELRKEAEHQYIYSNIVLANKSLLTLGKMKSEESVKLYQISTSNLKKDRKMLLDCKFLSSRNYRMGLMMAYIPVIYKSAILFVLRLKNY